MAGAAAAFVTRFLCAQEMEAVKAEVAMLRRKGGHVRARGACARARRLASHVMQVYTPAPPPVPVTAAPATSGERTFTGDESNLAAFEVAGH